MTHESFEDETTAALMSRYFVNIKVDREERPALQVIVRGEAGQLQSWREQLLPRLKPSQSAYFIASDLCSLPSEIAEKAAIDTVSVEKVTAWVCDGFSCRAPLFEIEPLLLLIDE